MHHDIQHISLLSTYASYWWAAALSLPAKHPI